MTISVVEKPLLFCEKPYLYLDTETYSEVPIKNGTHAYAERAEVMIATYAFGDGEVQAWDATENPEVPSDLREALLDETQEIVGANFGMFDSTVIRCALGIDIRPERILDTLAIAMSHGLPGGLDALCTILGVDADQAKSKTGHALILLFCRPQPFKHNIPKKFGTPAERRAAIADAQANWTGRCTRLTHKEQWEEFLLYAINDIKATRAIFKKLPKWNLPNKNNGERALFVLDQKINQFGVCIDVPFAKAAVRAAEKAKIVLAAACSEATEGEVGASTQRDKMLEFIFAEFGIDLPNMKKSTLEKLLDTPDLDEGLALLLTNRLQASSSSTAKYNALIKGVSSDGRFRGTLQFSGAQRTKRWASRAVQTQNLVKLDPISIAAWTGISFANGKPVRMPSEEEIETYLEAGIKATLANSEEFFFDDVMGMLSNCIRGSFMAPEGKKFVVSDLSGIEPRISAWLANEEWKLNSFRDYDNGIGEDSYKMAYAKSFGINPKDVNKEQRQGGKITELAFSFGGGVGAFFTFATAFNTDLEAMADKAIGAIPMEILRDSEGFMKWAEQKGLPKFGLSDRAYIVINAFKMLWRQAHPQISSYWPELASAFSAAILNPMEVITCRRVKLQFIKGWVRILLPDGSYLCYPQAQIEEDNSLSFMGMNQFSKKWSRINTAGPKLFENIVQANARNVFASAMQPAWDAGYKIVLHAHDELICEVPDTDEYTVDKLSAIMSTQPNWARDLPLAAAGFTSKRYKKG